MADAEKLVKRFRKLRASYNPEAQLAKLNERLLELMAEVLKLARAHAINGVAAAAAEQQMVEGKQVPTVEGLKDNGPIKPPRDMALGLLADATTTRDNGGRQFLLHRVTADHEYAQGYRADENTFTTAFATEWLADAQVAEKTRDSNNPLVSVWVPEDSIESVPGSAEPQNATHAGQKPQVGRFVVRVKPGKYDVYAERKA